MRVLVTGADGVLGRATVERFRQAGAQVAELYGMLTADDLVGGNFAAALELLNESAWTALRQESLPSASRSSSLQPGLDSLVSGFERMIGSPAASSVFTPCI